MTDNQSQPDPAPAPPPPSPDPVVSLQGVPLPPEVMGADPELTSDSVYGSAGSRGYFADDSDGRSER